jgi:hypothetical protein
MGWATLGIAGGPDPGHQLSGPDPLAQVDQVLVVVGVVVAGPTAIAQPQADPTPATVLVAQAADVAAGDRDQGGAGRGKQVDALMPAPAPITGCAPALANLQRGP